MPALSQWFPNHKGLAIGLTYCGYGIGGVAFNQIQTLYVNPENKPPETEYFTDEAILDRLPSLFLVLAACYFGLQILACLLIFEADRHQTDEMSPTLGRAPAGDAVFKIEGVNDVLRIPLFYVIWLITGFCFITTTFTNTLYKSFGLSFIDDDHFLATVGSATALGGAICKLFWGKFFDKFGARVGVCT